jgi:hypothetical protein
VPHQSSHTGSAPLECPRSPPKLVACLKKGPWVRSLQNTRKMCEIAASQTPKIVFPCTREHSFHCWHRHAKRRANNVIPGAFLEPCAPPGPSWGTWAILGVQMVSPRFRLGRLERSSDPFCFLGGTGGLPKAPMLRPRVFQERLSGISGAQESPKGGTSGRRLHLKSSAEWYE